MRNIKLTIEYDGTNYHGWQRQPNGITIQEVLENTIRQITKEDTVVIGSGRTDAGVHALAQIANFKSSTKIPSHKIALAINSALPADIAVLEAEDVQETFHSQYDAISKTYIYKILSSKQRTALERDRVWFIPDDINIGKMNIAAENLIGTHDFKVFSKSGSNVKSTIRHVYKAYFKKIGASQIEFVIKSDGFLKGMVRMILGTLINVGKDNISPFEFKKILSTGKKNKYVKSAPAHGLYLAKVEYKG